MRSDPVTEITDARSSAELVEEHSSEFVVAHPDGAETLALAKGFSKVSLVQLQRSLHLAAGFHRRVEIPGGRSDVDASDAIQVSRCCVSLDRTWQRNIGGNGSLVDDDELLQNRRRSTADVSTAVQVSTNELASRATFHANRRPVMVLLNN